MTGMVSERLTKTLLRIRKELPKRDHFETAKLKGKTVQDYPVMYPAKTFLDKKLQTLLHRAKKGDPVPRHLKISLHKEQFCHPAHQHPAPPQ